MNWRPIRGWTKPLHERGMKAGSMPERLLIGPGSPPSIDPVHPELSPPPEPCPISSRRADSKPLPDNNSKHEPPLFVIGVGWPPSNLRGEWTRQTDLAA